MVSEESPIENKHLWALFGKTITSFLPDCAKTEAHNFNH